VFNRFLRKGVLTAVVAGVGVLAMSAGPAFAGSAGVVEGVVDGGVTLNDGAGNGLGGGGTASPLICRNLNFGFVGVQVAGAAVSGTGAAVGTIVAGTSSSPITGGTTGNLLGACTSGSGENLLSATGHVNGFTFSPALSVVGTISGSCTGGSYERIGGAVVVSLNCSDTVSGPTGTGTTNNLGVTVAAWFQPDNTSQNGITNSFTHATFLGDFLGVGAS